MRVLIVSQVEIDFDSRKICNSGFAEIIFNYLNSWEEVVLIGPTKHSSSFITPGSMSGLTLVGLSGYQNSLWDKFWHYLLGSNKGYKFLKEHDVLNNNSLIQIRYPSLYTLSLARHFVKHKSNIVFYIAGDGVEAVKHNYPFLTRVAKWLEGQEIKTLRGKKVVTTGPVLAKKYSKFAQTHAYFSTTHSSVEVRKPRKILSNIIFVGTLEKRKRVIDLVYAIKILCDEGLFVKCSIVGDGSTRNDLEKHVQSLGLAKFISFKGYVSDREKLKEFYRQADFLVLPSLAEGTPRVLPEAMSLGVIPFAVKGVASNSYIIRDGQNGFLFSPKNHFELAEKLKTLIDDGSLYLSCLDNIFKYASSHTIDEELGKMWKFYLNKEVTV